MNEMRKTMTPYRELLMPYLRANQQSKAPKAPTATIALRSPSAKASIIHHMAHSFLSAFSGCSARSALPAVMETKETSRGEMTVIRRFRGLKFSVVNPKGD
jgi:hypothetical protein